MSLELTENAANHIAKIVSAAGGEAMGVRLEVLGGGCSGFSYKFGFATVVDPADDMVVERNGAKLVVDKTSLGLLDGSAVDYSESLMEAGFKVTNPNAASSCGCGSSFSVKDA